MAHGVPTLYILMWTVPYRCLQNIKGPQCSQGAFWPLSFCHLHMVLLLTKSHFVEPTGRQNTSLCDRKPAGINQVSAYSKVNVSPS